MGSTRSTRATAHLSAGQKVFRSILKVLLSLKMMLIVYITSLIAAALLFWWVEDGVTFWDSLYWADITSLSIGYGDISPETWVGRHIIAFFFTKLWLLIVIPTLAAHILVKVIKNANVFTHEEQEWLMDMIGKIAEKLGVKVPPQPKDTDYDESLHGKPATK